MTGWFANWISRTLSTNCHANIYLMHAPRTSQHSPGVPLPTCSSAPMLLNLPTVSSRATPLVLVPSCLLLPCSPWPRNSVKPGRCRCFEPRLREGGAAWVRTQPQQVRTHCRRQHQSHRLDATLPGCMAAADGTPASSATSSSWELVLAMRISWPPGPKLGSAQPQTCWRLWVTSLILKLHSVRLLRPCGGHARLVHLMRCVPPLAQQATLLDFDVRVRHCLAAMCNGSKLPGTLATAVWHFALLCPTPPLPTSLLLATWTRCLTAVPCCPHQQPPGPSLLNSHLDAPLTIEAAAAKQRRCLTKLVDSAILGFAVTGPQRTESLSQATNKPVSAAAAYADPKATHQDTGRLCSEQGVHFQPMVAETTGAWDKTASHVLHIVAAAVAAREGAAVADLYSRLLQELSITTRRFRAQAALRRRAEIINQTQPIARASAVLPEG